MSTETVAVQLGRRSYDIQIGKGAVRNLDTGQRRTLIVSNTTVAPLYLDHALAQCAGAESIVLPDGEQYKTLHTAQSVLDHLADNGYHRDSVLVALGGGVIGDITGFAAALYHRGIDFIQVPTTLLAMVDSSVGGKTGVNHAAGKNLIGAFHQPIAVHADLDTLASLADREYRAGLAEVVKYGLLGNAEFLGWLENNAAALAARDADALAHTVAQCCRDKAAIVAADEREAGQRALLNLGHTFGHAIEAHQGYGAWLHGEAVAAGMMLAARMSARLGLLDSADLQRIAKLYEALGLPADPPPIPPARFAELMGRDKKVLAGQLRLVLLRKLGDAFITSDFDPEALDATLRDAA